MKKKENTSHKKILRIIKNALAEDIGKGDITTMAIIRGDKIGQAQAIAKDDFIVAGIDVFQKVFLFLDDRIEFEALNADGEKVKKGETIVQVAGPLASILQAERVALNLFQRMCGIATLTGKFVEAVSGTKAKILDTRKTIPGLRLLDKLAVKIGGGFNHRMGLYDGVLIKDNHIAAAGGIEAAVTAQKQNLTKKLKIEIETKNLREVEEALNSGVDIIMLDNMPVDEMTKAVALVRGKALLEASGNVSLQNVARIAATGVDFISVGEITHSVRATDIALKITAGAI
jgi:nicotinate-nucleotide pyrophosphorylase (carboxylating)